MRYLDEYSNSTKINGLIDEMKKSVGADAHVSVMEFCGGHTHALFQTGLIDLLPPNLNMIHGPGCPVCVLPAERIESFAELLLSNPNIIGCVYADLLKVPFKSRKNLAQVKAQGAQLQHIHSPTQILKIAQDNPGKDVVFFALGFETTLPATLLMIEKARELKLTNLSVYFNHVKTEAALNYILAHNEGAINGLLAPGHVATVIGEEIFKQAAQQYQLPIVISGFTPWDIGTSLQQLLKMLERGEADCSNNYLRAVRKDGNPVARSLMDKMLVNKEKFNWRGLGEISHSAYQLAADYHEFDAETKFDFPLASVRENKACLCPQVLLGKKSPLDCKLYGSICTPLNPQGSCMVSSEGACSAYFRAGRVATKKDAHECY